MRPFPLVSLVSIILSVVAPDAHAEQRGRGVVLDPGWSSETFLVPGPAQPVALPFSLNLAGNTVNSVGIDKDGFLSFAAGDFIAPFRAPVAANTNTACADQFSLDDCDLSYATRPGAFRASWGLVGRWDPAAPAANRTRGVHGNGPAAGDRLNRFQIILKDRGNGDFDIDFVYDYLEWGPGTAGVKIGPATIDFARFFDRLTGYNLPDSEIPAPLMPPLPTCAAAQPIVRGPFLDRSVPFVCNAITVRVTNGVPTLPGYTASLRVTAQDAAGTNYSGENTRFGWDVTNDGPDTATNARLDVDLPPGVTFISSTGAACSLAGPRLTCPLGSLANGGSAPVRVLIRRANPGPLALDARATADQYDPVGDNHAIANGTFDANSDIHIDTCAAIGTISAGSTATLSCTVSNSGPQDSNAVTMKYTLPAQLAFSASSDCTASGNTLTCSDPQLDINDSRTFNATLKATGTGSGTIGAALRAATLDRTMGNNNQAVSVVVSPSGNGGSAGKSGGGSLEWWTLMLFGGLAVSRRREPSR
ncbi:MAG TPA: DUF11 domain-containing protein [Steroidobacteraceae bacterium]|nr:DUF11 domain-containing protein [Steroidobacteraceae bacterium]